MYWPAARGGRRGAGSAVCAAPGARGGTLRAWPAAADPPRVASAHPACTRRRSRWAACRPRGWPSARAASSARRGRGTWRARRRSARCAPTVGGAPGAQGPRTGASFGGGARSAAWRTRQPPPPAATRGAHGRLAVLRGDDDARVVRQQAAAGGGLGRLGGGALGRGGVARGGQRRGGDEVAVGGGVREHAGVGDGVGAAHGQHARFGTEAQACRKGGARTRTLSAALREQSARTRARARVPLACGGASGSVQAVCCTHRRARRRQGPRPPRRGGHLRPPSRSGAYCWRRAASRTAAAAVPGSAALPLAGGARRAV